MLLKSYSYNNSKLNTRFYYEIWNTIFKLKKYFIHFCGRNADEAMQAVFMHVLYHFNSDKGNLEVYIKSLARVMMKKKNKEISVDFLEQTLTLEEKGAAKKGDNSNEIGTSPFSNGRANDFTNDVIDNIEHDVEVKQDIILLALQFMDKYVKLCNALLTYNTSTTYYPELFIKTCINLNNKYSDFNSECLSLYNQYQEYFNWFLSLDDNNKGDQWHETDYFLLTNNTSKRIKFINSITNEPVEDADTEEWYVKGNIGNKRIVKVYYEDIWNLMCDLVESNEINECKFILNDYYILKSFGGSISVINVDLFNYYDLFRVEIITNLLKDTGGRLINIGSKNAYLLLENDCLRYLSKERVVRGYNIKFDWKDITETL